MTRRREARAYKMIKAAEMPSCKEREYPWKPHERNPSEDDVFDMITQQIKV